MEITLKEIKIEQKDILEKLLQLYLHNISSDFPMDFNSNTGLYEYDDINKYFENENNKAFFILKENDIAGFILIDILDEKNIIQEIFVLNNYKRKGIGKIATNMIFDKYKGNWEIKSLPCSKTAENFWINSIKEYTKDNYNLEYIGKFNRAVITFNNKQKEK